MNIKYVTLAVLNPGKKWWPDLFLRRGRRLIQVSPEQASQAVVAIREATGLGASPHGYQILEMTESPFGFKASIDGTVFHFRTQAKGRYLNNSVLRCAS